jgi:hypothetical protein
MGCSAPYPVVSQASMRCDKATLLRVAGRLRVVQRLLGQRAPPEAYRGE